jgi:ABC-2 type transport system permease protein
LALFVILYLVFARIFKAGKAIPFYPVYLLTGIVLWNYFSEVTSGSVGSIVGRGDIIRKLNFPKYVIVLAGSASALINLFLNFIIIAIFMAITHVPLRLDIFAGLLLIAELFVFALAVAFFLSALYVKLRDINYIWEVILQAAFYATPILYPLSLIPDRYAKWLLLNPMAQIIQDFRYLVVTPETPTINTYYSTGLYRLGPIGVALVTVVVAAAYFRSRSKYFAEEV